MKAPSERHLQDWIWNRRQFFKDMEPEDDHIFRMVDIFAKEYRLPSGIADFLTLQDGTVGGMPKQGIVVVETKKDAIDLKALAQTLRYIRDIQTTWHFALAGEIDLEMHGEYFTGIPCVEGLMIGSSTTDDVIVAADAAHVAIVTYDFDGDDEYTFEWQFARGHRRSVYMSYHDSLLGDKIREAHNYDVDHYLNKDILKLQRDKLGRSIDINTLWRIFGESDRTL